MPVVFRTAFGLSVRHFSAGSSTRVRMCGIHSFAGKLSPQEGSADHVAGTAVVLV